MFGHSMLRPLLDLIWNLSRGIVFGDLIGTGEWRCLSVGEIPVCLLATFVHLKGLTLALKHSSN